MTVRRVLVAGTVGAGKSTLVKTIAESGMVCTERIATDVAAQLKLTTTVAFDFSRVSLRPDLHLHVYGAPGQCRFSFMWELLLRQAHLCLVLVAAHRPDDDARTQQIIEFVQQRSPVPLVLGLTHLDCLAARPPASIRANFGADLPLFPVNPLDKSSVLNLLTDAAHLLD